MGDGDENHGAQGCGGNRVQKTSAKNFELHKDPATDKRTNKAKNNVRDATKAASAGDFSREPAGDQAHQKPPDKPMRFDPDAKNSLCEHVRSNHEASSGNKDCIRVFVPGKEHGQNVLVVHQVFPTRYLDLALDKRMVRVSKVKVRLASLSG